MCSSTAARSVHSLSSSHPGIWLTPLMPKIPVNAIPYGACNWSMEAPRRCLGLITALDILTSRRKIGVTSTPVVDRAAGIVYLTSKCKLNVAGKPHYHHHLHALDLKTGAEKLNGPTVIAETIVNDPQNFKDAKN